MVLRRWACRIDTVSIIMTHKLKVFSASSKHKD
jgi:hypothetical protein